MPLTEIMEITAGNARRIQRSIVPDPGSGKGEDRNRRNKNVLFSKKGTKM